LCGDCEVGQALHNYRQRAGFYFGDYGRSKSPAAATALRLEHSEVPAAAENRPKRRLAACAPPRKKKGDDGAAFVTLKSLKIDGGEGGIRTHGGR